MKCIDALKSLSNYPIPTRTIEMSALARGVDIESEASQSVLTSKGFRLTTADLAIWLSKAPNISQAGISYSFTDDERRNFRRQAISIYNEYGEKVAGGSFGYKGDKL